MILCINTSTGLCDIAIFDDAQEVYYEQWQADRMLADELLTHLEDVLSNNSLTWSNLTGIGVFLGPGSFTGLRIGASVMNTIADTLHLPIVGTTGENWKMDALKELNNGRDDELILPYYGQAPNITTPRK